MKNFRPEEAFASVAPEAFNETWCRERILQAIHGAAGAVCPHCSTPVTGALVASFFAGKRLVCKGCHTWFDARTGTILAGSSLKYSQVFCLAFLLAARLPAKEIAARVGVNQSTVYDWKDRLSFGA